MVRLIHEIFMCDGAMGGLGIFWLGQIGRGCKVGVGDGNIGVVAILGVGITVGVRSTGLHAVKTIINNITNLLMKMEEIVLL